MKTLRQDDDCNSAPRKFFPRKGADFKLQKFYDLGKPKPIQPPDETWVRWPNVIVCIALIVAGTIMGDLLCFIFAVLALFARLPRLAP
jgi:hypothetical protein